MKKSRSSIPRLEAREDAEESPPGLEGTEGREPAAPEEPAAVVRVAMAVGNTKDGSELPAKPILVYPVPLSRTMTLERDMLLVEDLPERETRVCYLGLRLADGTDGRDRMKPSWFANDTSRSEESDEMNTREDQQTKLCGDVPGSEADAAGRVGCDQEERWMGMEIRLHVEWFVRCGAVLRFAVCCGVSADACRVPVRSVQIEKLVKPRPCGTVAQRYRQALCV